MSSTGPPDVKRSKGSESLTAAWDLVPVTVDEMGPIHCEKPNMAPTCVHSDFKDFHEAIELQLGQMKQHMTPEFICENYNEAIKGLDKIYARTIVSVIRDQMPGLVRAGCLQTESTRYGGEYCIVRSKFFDTWMPVMEEAKQYGPLTYGNFYALINCLGAIIKSENPYVALRLREIP